MRLKLADFANERDWNKYHTPRNLMLAMVGELGELSEIFQWRGASGCLPGLADWKEKDRVHLGEEISDVLMYLIRLADRCEIDLCDAVLKKIVRNGEKYPVKIVKGSSKKYNEYTKGRQ